MNIFDKIIYVLIAITFFVMSPGCSPEVGSEKWCAEMQEKPKGEWTANETSDYAKHCMFK